MIRRASWLLVLLFGLSLAGATLMNVSLISQSRKALDEGILSDKSAAPLARYHVAVVLPDTNDSFFDGLIEGVTAASGGSEAAVQIFRYKGNSVDEAETLFQLCLSAKVDGIILYSPVNDRTAARLKAAAAENVVFVPVGTQSLPGNGQGFIGSSSLLQGVESGNQLALKLGESARIGIILSPDGIEAPLDDPVYQGVRTALRSYPGASIVQVSRARPGILSGEEAAQAMLKANPGINALVCASAPITEGAAQVVVDQGRVGKVVIIGTDESPSINRFVDKGVIAASIVRESHLMGSEAMRAFSLARSGKPLQKAVEVGFLVRTRTTATQAALP